jgi:hypothetical protein
MRKALALTDEQGGNLIARSALREHPGTVEHGVTNFKGRESDQPAAICSSIAIPPSSGTRVGELARRTRIR